MPSKKKTRIPKRIAIYHLVDPRDGRVRYVGQTQYPVGRLAMHICSARRGRHLSPVLHWIRELLDAGLKPEMRGADLVFPRCANAAEAREIAARRADGDLLNDTRRHSGPNRAVDPRRRMACPGCGTVCPYVPGSVLFRCVRSRGGCGKNYGLKDGQWSLPRMLLAG